MNKETLIATIRANRASLTALWAGATDEQLITRPGPQPGWSVKDLIAHITYWEQDMLANLDAVYKGQPPFWSDVDETNDRVFTANRTRDLADIQAAFQQSLAQVLAHVASLSQAQLEDSRILGLENGTTVSDYVSQETFKHYEQHRGDVRAWAARVGLLDAEPVLK